MEKKYNKEIIIQAVTPEIVDKEGFLLKEHAEAIMRECNKRNYFVSFRKARDATLYRIHYHTFVAAAQIEIFKSNEVA